MRRNLPVKRIRSGYRMVVRRLERCGSLVTRLESRLLERSAKPKERTFRVGRVLVVPEIAK